MIVVTWACVFSLHLPARAQSQFIPLGFLPDGNFASGANAVSDHAPYTVVGFGNTQAVSRQAFRWTAAGGMVGLGGSSEAFDVSADGSVIVGRDYGTGGFAWRWTSATGRASLGTGEASSVSADGNAIAGSGGDRGFRWTSTTGRVDIPLLPGATTNYNPGVGISADGRYVVGQGNTGSALRGYRFDSMANSNLLLEARTTDSGRDITPDGQIVVGSAGGTMGRWINGVLVNQIQFPGAGGTRGHAVTADGSTMVGYAALPNLIDRAVIWDAVNGIRLIEDMLTNEHALDLTGWDLKYGYDISADGRAIVGWGTDPQGFTQAWLAIVPEPGSAGWILFTAIALGARHRRTNRRSVNDIKSSRSGRTRPLPHPAP